MTPTTTLAREVVLEYPKATFKYLLKTALKRTQEEGTNVAKPPLKRAIVEEQLRVALEVAVLAQTKNPFFPPCGPDDKTVNFYGPYNNGFVRPTKKAAELLKDFVAWCGRLAVPIKAISAPEVLTSLKGPPTYIWHVQAVRA